MVLLASAGPWRLVRLAHVRRMHDASPGTLEVRVLAQWRVHAGAADAPSALRDAVGRFLLIAGDQAFTGRRGRESATALRRLARRLGVTSPAGGGGSGLLREPVGLLGIAAAGLAAVAAIAAPALAGVEDALGSLGALALLLALVAWTLLGRARRWTRVPGRAD